MILYQIENELGSTGSAQQSYMLTNLGTVRGGVPLALDDSPVYTPPRLTSGHHVTPQVTGSGPQRTVDGTPLAGGRAVVSVRRR